MDQVLANRRRLCDWQRSDTLAGGRPTLDWKDTALWFGWGLVCGFFWATVTWWNRERAFRNASGGRSGAAD